MPFGLRKNTIYNAHFAETIRTPRLEAGSILTDDLTSEIVRTDIIQSLTPALPVTLNDSLIVNNNINTNGTINATNIITSLVEVDTPTIKTDTIQSLTLASPVTVNDNLSIVGNQIINGTVIGTSTASFTNNVDGGSLSTTGILTVGSTATLNGNVNVTSGTLAVTNNETVGGTLGVTGVGTFSNNVGVSGLLNYRNIAAVQLTGPSIVIPSSVFFLVAFPGEAFDTTGLSSPPFDTVTINRAGIYSIVGLAAWTPIGVIDNRTLTLLINGTITINNNIIVTMMFQPITHNTSIIRFLVPGNTIQLLLTQSTGAPLTVNASLSVSYLGDI